MKMKLLGIKHLQNFIKANPLPSEKPLFPVLYKLINQRKSEAYHELLNYLTFKDYTETALKELKKILNKNSSLEQEDIKKWILRHLEIFNKNLFCFGIDYLDSGNDLEGNLHLPSIDEYVDKTKFIFIINFWECMWLLYFEGYHIKREKRSVPDSVGSYYHTPPNQNEATNIEKVWKYLEF